MAKQQNLGLSHWITTGNEAGVQVADALHWLAFDPDTDLIMTYIEGARDMVRLRAALQANKKAGKAVVMMKVGFTEAGRKAALAHTASHTGDDDEFAASLSEFGVHRVANLSELIRITRVLDFAHSLSQLNICDKAPSTAQPQSTALLSISGGAGIMMADRAEQLGLSLPTFPHDAAQRLQVAISFSSAANPIDVTGQVFSQPEVLTQAIEDAASCGLYTNLVIFLAGAALIPSFWAKLQTCLSDLRNRSSNVNTVFCGIVSAEQTAWLESHGCLVTSDPVDAVDVVALLSGHRLPYRIKS
jgi:acyl-CoA synthetase (NDP forming)